MDRCRKIRAMVGAAAAVLAAGLFQSAAAGAEWPEQQVLQAFDHANNRFGGPVAVDGSYLAAGAPSEGHYSEASGAVYIYERDAAGWTGFQRIENPEAYDADKFGAAVSISGQYGIFASPMDDYAGASNSGSAYVFQRTSGGWEQVTHVGASDPRADDYFGRSVSISGDYCIAGAMAHNELGSNGTDKGAAYIYRRDGSDWVLDQKLLAPDATAHDFFGSSVAISGDWAAVGAYKDDDRGADSGSVYVFHRQNGAWAFSAKLTASDGSPSAGFGMSLSLSDQTLLVGAPYSNRAGTMTGSAYVFERTGESWTETACMEPADSAAYDEFALSVSLRGDFALVAAYVHDAAGTNAGAAYAYQRTGPTWTQVSKLTASDALAYDLYGSSVAVDEDTAVVMSLRAAGGVTDARAYVYDVPEPLTASMLLTGAAALLPARPRRKRKLKAKKQ